MPYISNTDRQRREMLASIGMKAEDLFAEVPYSLALRKIRSA